MYMNESSSFFLFLTLHHHQHHCDRSYSFVLFGLRVRLSVCLRKRAHAREKKNEINSACTCHWIIQQYIWTESVNFIIGKAQMHTITMDLYVFFFFIHFVDFIFTVQIESEENAARYNLENPHKKQLQHCNNEKRRQQ